MNDPVKSKRVDFRQIKERVSIEALLSRYEVRLHKSGQSLRGACPIPCGMEGGQNCFSVNSQKQVFKCFHKGCDAVKQGGDVLELVKLVEGVSLREAGVKLAEWFAVGESALPQAPPVLDDAEPEGAINPPLGFELKNVDHRAGAEYLKGRGFENWGEEECQAAGIGVAALGMFRSRLVLPLDNERGELVGYAGRSLDGSEPKYLFPSAEKGFRKSQLLYNLNRVLLAQIELGSPRYAVLVEGFFDCLWISSSLGECSYQCVALMGSSLSAWQEEKLCEHFERIVLMFDGDDSGRKCTNDCLVRLGRRRWVRAIELEEGEDPAAWPAESLNRMLAATLEEWKE